MIPKIIHYCWFGGNKKNKLIKKCIKSWKKYCPDYEIIEWNENNFDLNCCDYVREAYEEGKWAFVSDYVRIWALYNYGGVYLDTDVEITKRLDAFLEHAAFTGFETAEYPFTAVFGCEKGHIILKTIMDSYITRKFKVDDNCYDMTTNTKFVTDIFVNKYKVKLNNETQILEDGLVIYSSDYFCPKNFIQQTVSVTVNTHAIHWFNASWHGKEFMKKMTRRIRKDRFYTYVDIVKHIPNILFKKLLGEYLYDSIKTKIKGDYVDKD